MTLEEYVEAIYSILAKGNITNRGTAATQQTIAQQLVEEEDEDGNTIKKNIADIKAALIADIINIDNVDKETAYKKLVEIKNTLFENSVKIGEDQQGHDITEDSVYKKLSDLVTSLYNGGSAGVSGDTTIMGLLVRQHTQINSINTDIANIKTTIDAINTAITTLQTTLGDVATNTSATDYSIRDNVLTLTDKFIPSSSRYNLFELGADLENKLDDVITAINGAKDAIVAAINNHA